MSDREIKEELAYLHNNVIYSLKKRLCAAETKIETLEEEIIKLGKMFVALSQSTKLLKDKD